MARSTFYKTLIAAAAAGAVFAFGGCNASNQHATMRAKSMERWNLTRIGIMYQLAEQQYKVGDYEKCNETLRDAFATKAQFAPIYILAAKVQIEQGSLEAAAVHLNQAIHINANEPEPYYLLGVLYQRWQKPDVACDYYKQAWARKPDEARYMLAAVEMEISLNRLDEAQATLQSKLVYFEESAALRVAFARIATLKNDFATAADCYRDATNLMPDDQNLRRSYAEALFYAKRYPAAASLLEELRKRPDVVDKANLLMMLGQTYMGMRRNVDARNCFQEVIRDKPEDTLAYLSLGQACVETGDLGIAYAAARKVLHNEPDNVQAMIILALVQQKEKKIPDAQATLGRALKLSPTDTTVLCMLGVNAQQLGEKEQALAFYRQAVQANPKDTWATELLNKAAPSAVIAPAGTPAPVSAAPAEDDGSDVPAAANTPVTLAPEGSPESASPNP